jgi:class 3 adenylate cyclase
VSETGSIFSTVNRQLSFLSLAANLLGALLTFLYFTFIEYGPGRAASGQANYAAGFAVFGALMALLFILGTHLDKHLCGRLRAWEERLQNGTPASAVPAEVQSDALNYVILNTLVGFVMWVLAGLFFAATYMLQGASESVVLRIILGTVGVGGVLTVTIFFFAADLIWRPVIPLFFPAGKLSAAPGFRLPVLGRLLIVFLLVGVWPSALLVKLSLERAQMLVTAPDPQAVLDNLVVLEFFILGVGLLASVGMAFFMTRGLTGPLQTLQAAMARVGQNDFTVSVPVTSNDELGYLAEGFNTMTAGLRQGEMLRTLLNLYVTPQVAREALEHGAKLGGTLTECTVLFSDIRGFTSLAEQLPPTELIALLNKYMSAMVAVIVEHGGMVNKFGGDSILAVFGTPLNPAKDHAARAIRAASGMRRALAQFNQAQAGAGGPTLRIGIGIATGPVVAGNMGGQERIEYTVIGDTVNLASRLQSLTKELAKMCC